MTNCLKCFRSPKELQEVCNVYVIEIQEIIKISMQPAAVSLKQTEIRDAIAIHICKQSLQL